jgi:hypothetical protein
MKRTMQIIILSVIVSVSVFHVLHALPAVKSAGLFPRKDYVDKHSKVFFKKVNLTQPLIAKVEFFVRTETYLSAYIDLAVFIVKNDYFSALVPVIEKEFPSFIEQFASYKKELQVENYTEYMKKQGMSKFGFYLSAIYTLSVDYNNNMLSGDDAFRLWNILSDIIDTTYKEDGKTLEDAAVLKVASHFIFFKNYNKWEKKAAKILKKIDLKTVSGKEILFVSK